MLFRWSDGHSFAVKFQADRQTLAWRSTAALEEFQRARAKRYHDGATRRDMVYFPTAELHVGLNGKWWNPGRVRSVDGLAYFETTPFAARGAEIEDTDESVAERFEQQAFLLLVKSAELWERAEETARWLGVLSDLADGVVEAVRDR